MFTTDQDFNELRVAKIAHSATITRWAWLRSRTRIGRTAREDRKHPRRSRSEGSFDPSVKITIDSVACRLLVPTMSIDLDRLHRADRLSTFKLRLQWALQFLALNARGFRAPRPHWSAERSPQAPYRASGLDAMGRAARQWHHRRCKQTMERPHVTAEWSEQIPRRSRARRDTDRGYRDGPVELAGRRCCAGNRTQSFEEAQPWPRSATATSASLAEGGRSGRTHDQADRCRLWGRSRRLLA